MSNLKVGGHLSLGRKPRSTVERAADDGFESMQIFASSPGNWRPPLLREELAVDFRLSRAERGIDPLFIHAIYLINLASANPDLVRRSRSSLIATMQAAERLGAVGVITHLGSHAGRGYAAVAEQIAEGLVEILEATPDGVDLILENSAGAGGIVGAELAELGDLIRFAAGDPRLKVALDTAHLFASGWDFRDPEVAGQLVAAVDGEIGLCRLVVIHANDSKTPLASRRDRHANIGEGHIGIEGFRSLVAQTALRRLPWILETPNLEERVVDRTRLQALVPEFLVAP